MRIARRDTSSALGAGGYFFDLGDEPVHQLAAEVYERHAGVGQGVLPQRGEALAYPLHQRALALGGEVYDLAVFGYGLHDLRALVRLEVRVLHEGQSAPVRDVGDELFERGGVRITAVGEIIAPHLGQRALREEGQRVHGVRELAQGRALAVEPVVAEVVAPAGEAGGLYLAKESLAQIVLLPIEQIEPRGTFGFQFPAHVAVVEPVIRFCFLLTLVSH